MKIIIFVVLLFLGSGCSNSTSKPFTLNIIHMNDIHSHLDEEPINLTINDALIRVDAGGYPRVASVIKNLKQDRVNNLLLNAGDALQGTLYYTLFKGEVDAKMMNAVGWDAFVLGNHEFDDGNKNLQIFLDELSIPIIAANIDATGDSELFDKWQPYIIRDFEGEAVGIIGIDTLNDTVYSSNPGENLKFSDEINTTQYYVDELEAIGINKIILLSHFGYENDEKLASHVKGIDVIVGGHTHTIMGSFDELGLSSDINYPQELFSLEGKKICIVQAGSYAKIVGNLHVSFDNQGDVISCSGSPILAVSDNFSIKNEQGEYEDVNESLYSTIIDVINQRDDITIAHKDTQVETILQSYKEQVDEKKLQSIGIVQETINHVRVPNSLYNNTLLPLGSDVAPLVAKAFYERVKDSDAVILNAGAVRTNLDEGNISIHTVYTLLPFSNTLYTFLMSGDEIHRVLEDALSYIKDSGGSSGAFPYSYALRYDINMKKSRGERVQNLEIFSKSDNRYLPIDNTKIYIITTISYLATAKDGYETFGTIVGQDTYFDYANSFVEYVKHLEDEAVAKLPSREHCIKSYEE